MTPRRLRVTPGGTPTSISHEVPHLKDADDGKRAADNAIGLVHREEHATRDEEEGEGHGVAAMTEVKDGIAVAMVVAALSNCVQQAKRTPSVFVGTNSFQPPVLFRRSVWRDSPQRTQNTEKRPPKFQNPRGVSRTKPAERRPSARQSSGPCSRAVPTDPTGD
jgi:hypothetical protein